MNLLQKLSIRGRLVILVGIALSLMVINGIFGLNDIRRSNDAIHELHSQGMVNTGRLGEVIRLMQESHSQFLLTLQHDPSSSFSNMHDHAVAMHTRAVEKNLTKIKQDWEEFTSSNLTAEEQQLAGQFSQALKEFEEHGFRPFEEKIKAGDYLQANVLILRTIKETLHQAEDLASQLLAIEMKHAEADFLAAEARYESAVSWSLSLLGAAIVASTALAWLIISGISRAVKQLDDTATRLAGGDLRARVDYHGRDELRHVADSFNAVAEAFSDTVTKVREAVSQVASAAEETSVVSDQTLEGIRSQQTETEQVATAMNQMNATVHEVASNAASAAEAAHVADDSAAQGQQVVRDTLAAMDRLATDVEQANQVILKLRGESEQIGTVLDVIRNIADQTNLLALNAAIEAARAGEQGRGFAVVADEVRTLASRTQDSTQEIQKMIEGLQEGAANAVRAMEEGHTQAQASVDQAARAGEALEAITTAVDRISDMNTQIASAVEEQSAVAEEINGNIHNISTVANQTFHGAEQTADASTELARLSNGLREEVARFKL